MFRGETNVDQMARSLSDLIDWLFKENSFPTGAYLLTGTGIVPPNDFTLAPGDDVSIDITGIGTLRNPSCKAEVPRRTREMSFVRYRLLPLAG